MTDSRHDALAAADPRRSAWVSANAGAGKTHTLANRVTRLLLDGAPPQRILCLTYTKSAAAEMQTRLFDQLGRWAMLPDGKLAASIAEIGADVAGPDALRRARRLFAMALETPGGLRIQTIHSFCQQLLMRFPVEARVPPSFRVLEDQSAREMMADARAQVLERAGSGDEKLASAAAHLVTETSEARLKQILDAALGNDRRKIERFFAELPEGEDALANALSRAHGAAAGDTVEQIQKRFCAEAKADANQLLQIAAGLSERGKKDRSLGDILRSFVDFGCTTDAYAVLRPAFLTQDGALRKSLASKAPSSAQPANAQYLAKLADRYLEAEKRCRAARAASLAQAALTLADAVREVYAKAKRAAGALDYDDLIGATLNLLARSEAAQWVLYKLDGGLDHALIDEAQDTSPEQWRIVRALTEEFFAGAGRRDLFVTPRTIFAVGDEKQSIFSFQGADPTAFELNRQYFRERIGADLVDVRLETSRRSAPQVLEFVDELFKDSAARDGLTVLGDSIHHEALRKDAVGYVEFWPALKPPDTPDPDPWDKPVDVERSDSPVVQLANQIAMKIKYWLANNISLPRHDKPIRPGDIMILMPRREPFASEVIRRLAQVGVPVAGADRVRLKNEIAVMDLMALGRFVLLPEDDLNLAALLRSPLIDLSEDELFALAHGRRGSLWRALQERREQRASFTSADGFLSEMLNYADFVPPYEFFADALVNKGMRAKLLTRLGPEAHDAVDEFLSLALHYEGTGTPSLEGFLHWVDRGDAEIKRDMEHGRDEVRVMTVHGAKGLEADIVILPDTTTLPDPPGRRGELLYRDDGVIFPLRKSDACDAVQVAKDEAVAETLKEHRRLLYVALTRAKERLYICGFENKNGVRDHSWYQLAERAAKSLGRTIMAPQGEVLAIGDDGERSIDAAVAKVEKPLLPEWAREAPPAIVGRPRIIRPSDDMPENPVVASPSGPKAASRFRRGILIHALLARLPDVAPAERQTIAETFLMTQGQDADEARVIAQKTVRLLNHPDFAAAFAPGSKAELAIMAVLPELGEGARINGRLDRLAVTDGEVLAIDFKTNREPPERPDDAPAVYIRQMALYRLALAKIFPGKRIACALVWTEGPKLMALPESLLDAHGVASPTSLDLG
jgi:ATP-dependent helicase/nuclease subunit A